MPPPDPTKEQQDQRRAEGAALDNTLETIPDSDNDSSSSQQQQQQEGPPRQVIAVSVSKGPSAFFNLARKFLMTDEECDLSALEGAIVSAVDAAHLLERSQIATISRIQTSYVTVDPKKKKETQHTALSSEEVGSASTPRHHPQQQQQQYNLQLQQSHPPSATTTSHALHTLATAAQIGRENMEASYINNTTTTTTANNPSKKGMAGTLRRARMIITVRRTNAYKKWLEENPVPDMSVHYLPLD